MNAAQRKYLDDLEARMPSIGFKCHVRALAALLTVPLLVLVTLAMFVPIVLGELANGWTAFLKQFVKNTTWAGECADYYRARARERRRSESA